MRFLPNVVQHHTEPHYTIFLRGLGSQVYKELSLWQNRALHVGARQQGGAFEKSRDFLLFLQYYILQEDQPWMISHLQSLRALHN